MKKLRKLITFISFQIGVNVIGIPEIVTFHFKEPVINQSKFHS